MTTTTTHRAAADRDRSPRAFRSADDVLAIEPSALERAFAPFALDADDPPVPVVRGGVALLDVVGPLESRAGWFWDGYGGEHGVVDRFQRALAEPEVGAVVLRIDSPGGACAGLLEAVDEMRAAAAAAGKPVVAFADGGAYSAGYALATVAEEIYVTRASGVGSIGVIATAVSMEKALEQEGIAVAVVASGSQKTDLHPALPISDAAKNRLRARVTVLADLFADEVARARGLTREAVLAQQAAVFHGEAAVSARLADGVSTLAGAVARARALATERAAKAAKEKQMSSLVTALGLAATATEVEVAARAGALRDTETALSAATGESNPVKALERVAAWKRDAAKLAETEARLAETQARAEQAEATERAAYVADVLKAKRIADDATRRLYERQAAADFAAFQAEFPRPSREELEARAGDDQRLLRIAPAPKVVPTEAGADATDAAEAASVHMSIEAYKAAKARMSAKGAAR